MKKYRAWCVCGVGHCRVVGSGGKRGRGETREHSQLGLEGGQGWVKGLGQEGLSASGNRGGCTRRL